MTRECHPRKFILRLGRRQAAAGLALGLLPRTARGDDDLKLDEDLRNLRLIDGTEGGRRFVLLVPRYLQPDQRLDLAVLLHGLGETGNERLGAYAWVEKYGLGRAWQRLKRPPIERTSKRGEWTDARLAEVNAELQSRPFRGLALVCPFMPLPGGPADLDAYARWIERSLLPRVRKETRVVEDAEHTFLCGVSLGGYVSLEVLVRVPHLFGAWAGVQTALGPALAPGYAARLATAWRDKPPRPTLLLTSTLDHWKASSEALAAAFAAQKLATALRVVPGPHDQPWLEEAGTLEALHWLDRVHASAATTP
jgi:predicted esterase